ncbi:MAG: HlyC/CorC family transporter [Deltaproteobacteria bacterium]|nr:HlyC/CorC family transporter [Deltaproteobacteria bacterium]
MDGLDTLYVALLFVCLLLSAFFSSSETAFISLQKVRIQHLIDKKVRGARLVSRMVEKPEKLLSTILLGNNFVNTAAAALGTALAIKFWPEHGILISTIVVTVLLLIFSETTPKTIATRHAEGLALFFARPIEALSWLLTPFVVALSWIASGFSKMLGGAPVSRSLASEDEIRTMISMGHKEGTVEEEEAEMLHKVFEFGNRPVREVMVPRTEVIWVTRGTKLADFLDLYAKNPLSRFPVYEHNIDNIVGILAVKDILMAQAKGAFNNEDTIDDLIRPAYFTPETKRVSELFAEMRDKNFRITVVVDEFGGTAGIVSLSGLMEEIVGPVGDELAAIEKDYETINEYTFQVDGGMRVEEANDEMKLNIPEGDDYETVAGFILDLLGHIPKQGEQLKYKNFKIVITEMRGMKIENIRLIKETHAENSD